MPTGARPAAPTPPQSTRTRARTCRHTPPTPPPAPPYLARLRSPPTPAACVPSWRLRPLSQPGGRVAERHTRLFRGCASRLGKPEQTLEGRQNEGGAPGPPGALRSPAGAAPPLPLSFSRGAGTRTPGGCLFPPARGWIVLAVANRPRGDSECAGGLERDGDVQGSLSVAGERDVPRVPGGASRFGASEPSDRAGATKGSPRTPEFILEAGSRGCRGGVPATPPPLLDNNCESELKSTF